MSHDVVVVGAGPVGATLALALADTGLDVLAVDARPRGETLRTDRSLALSHGARLIYDRVGVWTALAATPGAVTAIERIDISQAGGFGTMVIDAAGQGVPALGYVVSYRALQRALDDALARKGVPVRFATPVAQVRGTSAYAAVMPEGGSPLTARLAVAADGAGAMIEGIARRRRDYGQVAIVAKAWLERPQSGTAYERFSPEGPVALLPEQDHYGLVWTQAPDEAARTLALADDAFLAALARRFGARAGPFVRTAERRSFPLALEYSTPLVATRIAAIGNAAQALHPIAGQGFNLGLRDAYELATLIARTPLAELGSRAMLQRYASSRAPDRRAGILFTHGLVHLFGGHALRWPRGLGLAVLDALPPAKRAFTRAMLYGWG